MKISLGSFSVGWFVGLSLFIVFYHIPNLKEQYDLGYKHGVQKERKDIVEKINSMWIDSKELSVCIQREFEKDG